MYDDLTITDDYVIAGHRRFGDPRFCISDLRGLSRTGPEGIDQWHRGWIISFEFERVGDILTKA